jgi:hypothetical protein
MHESVQMLLEAFPNSAAYDLPLNIPADWVADKSDAEDIIRGGLFSRVANGEFPFVKHTRFSIDPNREITDVVIGFNVPTCKIERELVTFHTRYILLKGSNWSAYLEIGPSSLQVFIASVSSILSQQLMQTFREGLEVTKRTTDEIEYYVYSESDFPSRVKSKKVHWSDIKENYPTSTRVQQEKLVKYRRSLSSNDPSLVVMQGEPGVGKTWFDRSLMTEWSDWAEFVVVADSESLFGKGGTSYLMNIIDSAPIDKTRVLVIEDCPDEVITGERSGGLSRLLSLTDGLVSGQKSLMILLTSNTNISQIDPALLRSGRALQKIKFSKFSIGEATKRLGNFGPAESEMSLADIYVRIGKTKSMSKDEIVRDGTYL